MRLEAERSKWRDALKRLVTIIQSLAERNMGLRGTSDALYDQIMETSLKNLNIWHNLTLW